MKYVRRYPGIYVKCADSQSVSGLRRFRNGEDCIINGFETWLNKKHSYVLCSYNNYNPNAVGFSKFDTKSCVIINSQNFAQSFVAFLAKFLHEISFHFHLFYCQIFLKLPTKFDLLRLGCQMVSFQTKNPYLGKFWRP
jgi:hypothetical protein